MNQEDSDGDDDVPQLSADTLAVLQEFLHERLAQVEIQAAATDAAETSETVKEQLFDKDLTTNFPEDWQMSQFWYDDDTSVKLAEEIQRLAGDNEKIVCLSCPSVFRACKGAKNVYLFEFDSRFKAFGSSYYFYDYNHPEDIPKECHGAYSVVIADPPFLSLECLSKLAEAVEIVKAPDAKVILCTGDIMSEHAEKLMNLKKTNFTPRHRNNLGNEFACFSNYDLEIKSS